MASAAAVKHPLVVSSDQLEVFQKQCFVRDGEFWFEVVSEDPAINYRPGLQPTTEQTTRTKRRNWEIPTIDGHARAQFKRERRAVEDSAPRL